MTKNASHTVNSSPHHVALATCSTKRSWAAECAEIPVRHSRSKYDELSARRRLALALAADRSRRASRRRRRKTR